MKHFYELTEEQQKAGIEKAKEIAKSILYDHNIFEQGLPTGLSLDKIAKAAAEGSTYTNEGMLEQYPMLN